ncbi:hypothetical protein [Flexibacterium corallicola]|uniref:hypothetical protein n=1 Tax=Flexibacterium corallicola TaxID=3037259 RepID=UPI00286F97B6|nr:hypothetical protein [Pseudovibrio sp. M1P-2-3]
MISKIGYTNLVNQTSLSNAEQLASKVEEGANGVFESAQKATKTPYTDQVSIALAAQNAMQEEELQTSGYYDQFFPVREGFSPSALTASIDDAASQTFSEGRTFNEVARLARTSLDEKLSAASESGEPYDLQGANGGKDMNTLFSDFDRRTLYAVSSNEGGQFTEDEQRMAKSLMRTQQSFAMGLYNGPAEMRSSFVDPFVNDSASRWQQAIEWLDEVSFEEKQSSEWIMQRAIAQRALENNPAE